jgi:hypothetical protein
MILGGFLPISAFARSSLLIPSNSGVMELPFGPSFGSFMTNMHATIGFLAGVHFVHDHPIIGISTTGSVSKFLVPFMRTQADQNILLSIYTPVIDTGDYVLMHPSDSNIAYASQLKPAVGNMGVEYFSLSDIEANAPILGSKGVTFISYDLEANLSPSSDLANPEHSMQKAAVVTHKYGLQFMAAPSHILTDEYYSSFAKVSDLYNLQAQAFESNPSRYTAYVHSTISNLKSVHPGMPVSVETSTALGTVSQMEQCFSLVADVADGSSTWYTDDAVGYTALQQYLNWFASHYG